MKRILSLGLLGVLLLVMSGCQATSEGQPGYEMISAEDAKTIMDTESDFVLLDVRTEEEYAAGHIEGAVLLPDYEIRERAEEVLPNKDQTILVYCRSGRRSKNAAAELATMGYRRVKEFGGILDWPYEIVK
ncbi:MAG: rhodanese-like domain-containing protein [Clostridia bacterium]|nr:rhodanese-like domain-containing protein [Clostridia bacterium]